MSEAMWQRPEEVAALLGVKPDSVVKKARRHEKAAGGTEWVRRVTPSADGGRRRVEIHSALVERWLAETDIELESRFDSSDSIAVQEMRRARKAESDLARELHEVELANRDKEISRLSAELMTKELETVRLRNQIENLGDLVAALTKDA